MGQVASNLCRCCFNGVSGDDSRKLCEVALVGSHGSGKSVLLRVLQTAFGAENYDPNDPIRNYELSPSMAPVYLKCKLKEIKNVLSLSPSNNIDWSSWDEILDSDSVDWSKMASLIDSMKGTLPKACQQVGLPIDNNMLDSLVILCSKTKECNFTAKEKLFNTWTTVGISPSVVYVPPPDGAVVEDKPNAPSGYRFWDFGGKLEHRHQWNFRFKKTNFGLIVFTLAGDSYCHKMFENNSKSRLEDSLELLKAIAADPRLDGKKVIVALTRLDLIDPKAVSLLSDMQGTNRQSSSFPNSLLDLHGKEQIISYIYDKVQSISVESGRDINVIEFDASKLDPTNIVSSPFARDIQNICHDMEVPEERRASVLSFRRPSRNI